MTTSRRRLLLMLIAIGALVLTAVAGYFVGQQQAMHRGSSMLDPAASQEKQPLYWVAPMDSNYRRDAPGKSPMGMELVPVYEQGMAASTDADIRISANVVQNLGVKTTEVIRAPFATTIEAVGSIDWNQATISMLHPRVAGWLDGFYIDSVGEPVKKGQVLFEVFSPQLVSAQREYLTAKRSGNAGLQRVSGERLQALGFTAAQVAALRRSGKVIQRLPYRATRDAVVMTMSAKAGMYVMPESNIASLASLSSVWVDIEVFESQARGLVMGAPVVAELAAFPGQQFHGQVSLIYPELMADSRTLRARVVLDNAAGQLRPNMYAKLRIQSADNAPVLQLPAEAVIRSSQGSRVLLALADGEFKVAPVSVGRVSRGRIEILEGLSVGDTVVTSGQFLLDSEANGEQAMARLNAEKSTVMGIGRLEKILPDGQLTLTHEPIAVLGWPTMTMDFSQAEQLSLDANLLGQEVQFEMKQAAAGVWEILSLKPAGSDSASHAIENMSQKATPAMVHTADAVDTAAAGFTDATVVQVMPAERRVKLAHQPIESLAMPAMTMRFNVENEVPLSALTEGDAVRFKVEIVPGKGMRITAMEKVDE